MPERSSITLTFRTEIIYITQYRHLPVISLRSSSFEISAMVDATRCTYCCQLSLRRLRTLVASVGTVSAESALIRIHPMRLRTRITRQRSHRNEYYIHQIVLVFYDLQFSHHAPRVIRRSEDANSMFLHGTPTVLFQLTVHEAAARGCRWRPRYSLHASLTGGAYRKIIFDAQ